MPHVNAHVVPSHVDWFAPVGMGHAVHDVPHELTLVLSGHVPEHRWLPVGQSWLHATALSMQAPAQSRLPVGHVPPHAPPVHVAEPPVGTLHGVHDPPQLAMSVLLTHFVPQRWKPLPHWSEQLPETQMGVPLAPAAQATHVAPHAPAESSRTQVAPHLW